jgi:serine phosphatase RsbU (regulator of sigma subunit)
MGNGIEAAVTMGKLRQAIQSAGFICPHPPVMLSAANSTLALHDRNVIATAVAGVLSPKTATIAFSSAGHPLPVMSRGGKEVETFEGSAPPLGVPGVEGAMTHTTELQPGDLAVFYTDGLIEGTRNIDIGERILRSALVSPNPVDLDDPASALHERVLGRAESRDDVAILTVARRAVDGAGR